MNKIINIQQYSQEKLSVDQARRMTILHKGELYKYFDEGLSRYVFVNEDRTKVIKLLINSNGKDWNSEEIAIYQKASEEAKAQMVPTRYSNGYIEQTYITPIKFSDKRLTIPQKLFAASCRGEVGWTKEGELLCFDLDEFKKY